MVVKVTSAKEFYGVTKRQNKEEVEQEIKKAIVPTQMELKAFDKVKELLEKEYLTDFEVVTLAQLQNFLRTSSKDRLAQD